MNLVQRRWLTHSACLFALIALCAPLCGCAAIIDSLATKLLGSKGHGRSHSRIVGPGTFEAGYGNDLYFNRKLTISIDSLFARLRTEDKATWSALDDFLDPAENLLTDVYSIALAPANLVPDYEDTKFVVHTEYSEWRPLHNTTSPLLRVPLRNERSGQLRCRAKLVSAEIDFNSLAPSQLSVKAKMLVQLQRFSPRRKTWEYVDLDHDSVEAIGDQMARDLIFFYNDYIEKKYGIQISYFPPDDFSDVD